MTDAETADLHLAGVYTRTVEASLDRIWENVFDWQHLDHLHDGSFAQCDLLERSVSGWRVALTLKGRAEPQIIALHADLAAGRYVSTTLSGDGIGTEIRVMLAEIEPHLTGVRVAFHLPESDPARLAVLGQAYREAYARLWDEDEAMMRHRETALARCKLPPPGEARIDFGSEADVRAKLPLGFDLGGEPFRLVDLDGDLVAYSTICPHWLGPLDDVAVVDGVIRCPWHGYRFDVRSGRCASGQELTLATPPSIATDGGRVVAISRATA